MCAFELLATTWEHGESDLMETKMVFGLSVPFPEGKYRFCIVLTVHNNLPLDPLISPYFNLCEAVMHAVLVFAVSRSL